MISVLTQYFRERFPLGGVVLVSLSFALFAVTLNPELVHTQRLFLVTVLALWFTVFLLRQRVTDEFKDFSHDTKNYPGRPVQRGLISKRFLVGLGLLAAAIELVSAFYISGTSNFIWYGPVFIYTILMAKEFFISDWLENHFTIYFIVHEFIFVIIGWWLIQSLGGLSGIQAFVWLISFVSVMSTIEIARKFEFRYARDGKVVNDTYPAVWGQNGARNTLELLMMISGICLAYALSNVYLAVISAACSLVLSLGEADSTKVRVVVACHIVCLAMGALFL